MLPFAKDVLGPGARGCCQDAQVLPVNQLDLLRYAGNTTYQRMSGSLLEGTDDEERDLQPVT